MLSVLVNNQLMNLTFLIIKFRTNISKVSIRTKLQHQTHFSSTIVMSLSLNATLHNREKTWHIVFQIQITQQPSSSHFPSEALSTCSAYSMNTSVHLLRHALPPAQQQISNFQTHRREQNFLQIQTSKLDTGSLQNNTINLNIVLTKYSRFMVKIHLNILNSYT